MRAISDQAVEQLCPIPSTVVPQRKISWSLQLQVEEEKSQMRELEVTKRNLECETEDLQNQVAPQTEPQQSTQPHPYPTAFGDLGPYASLGLTCAGGVERWTSCRQLKTVENAKWNELLMSQVAPACPAVTP